MIVFEIFFKIKKASNFRDKSDNVESLINIFSLLITEKRFLSAYEDYFNLQEIIDIVHQTTGLL